MSLSRTNTDGAVLVELRRGEDEEAVTCRWRLSEAWWARSFDPPTYGQLVKWLALAGPEALYRHSLRDVLAPRPKRALPPLRSMFWNNLYVALYVRLPLWIWRRVFQPLVMVALAVALQLLFLLLLPLAVAPVLRRVVLRIQRLLVASVGNSLAFVALPDSYEQMVGSVYARIEQLGTSADSVIVVAHSQGAAVAHEALRQDPRANVTSFLTLGAGLDKLTALSDRPEESAAVLARAGPLLMVPPLAMLVEAPSATNDALVLVAEALIVLAALMPLRYYRRLQHRLRALLPLPGEGASLKWLDLYASADPVPQGPTLRPVTRSWQMDSGAAGNASREVHNRRSLITDHTTYQKNVEQVLLPVLDRVCRATPIWLTRELGDYERHLERGWSRRRGRTARLIHLRLSTAVTLLATTMAASQPLLLAPWLFLVSAVLSWHVLTVMVWQQWDREDMARFAAWRAPAAWAPAPFICMLAAPALVVSGFAVLKGVPYWWVWLLAYALVWGVDIPHFVRSRVKRWAWRRARARARDRMRARAFFYARAADQPWEE